ncbi:MAG: hypothetical protein NWS20_01155 [Rickettsiaceae bacterium]|nr:hypothetical protein [Rickettsiaceae bacterium]
MNNKKLNKLEQPLRISKELFIGSVEHAIPSPEKSKKGRAQTVTFTLYNQDIEALERQLDRATLLSKRTKNKSVIIRMALKALENTTNEEYLNLYNEF